MPRKQAQPDAQDAPEPIPPANDGDWQLAWLGDTSRMLPGYPMSDLIVDAATGRWLVATGLYARMEPPQAAPQAAETSASES